MLGMVERETGIEPATNGLGSRYSTIELLPRPRPLLHSCNLVFRLRCRRLSPLAGFFVVLFLLETTESFSGAIRASQKILWRSGMATKKAIKRAAKKAPAKKSSRGYSPEASKDVETEMHEMKKGKLKSGRSGKKVTNPKQAIAIGLSKARKEGKKVPPPKS